MQTYHRRLDVLLFLVVQTCLAGACATSRTAQGAVEDDGCAVPLTLHGVVSDARGVPVEHAEVWQLFRARAAAADSKARLVGVTGSNGEVQASICYMNERELKYWRPANGDVTLRFLVWRDGAGARRVEVSPPTQDVIRVGAQRDESAEPSPSAYLLNFRATLE